MPNYTYNPNIPAASDNPSVSQGQMQTNCNSIASIVSVDLYGFGNNNGGTHQQVTIPLSVVPGTLSTTTTVLYNAAGIADPSSNQLFWKNSLGGGAATPYHLTPIKAWGTFAGASGTVIGSQISNASVARTGVGLYTVTLSANAIITTNYAVLLTCGLSTTGTNRTICAGYTVVSATRFDIAAMNVRNASAGTGLDDPTYITFAVLQI